MKIEQLMHQGVITCQANDTLNEAARIMWELDLGFLPVVGDDGHLVGTITDRDICMAAFTQGVRLADSSVASAMSTLVFACRPQDSVRSAEDLLSRNQLRRLPVIDETGRPIGIVSLSDLALRAQHEPRGDGVTTDEVTRTIRDVTKPRTVVQQRMRPTTH